VPDIERDGVSIHYEASGDGPAVILTHGYGATSQMWAGQIDLLSANHRLIVWDMRGHGLTDSPEDLSCYNEAETVDDIAAILDAEGVDSAVIGGLSLGGYMSLAFNVAYPDRTRALMPVSLYTSDAADDKARVDLRGRRAIEKKKHKKKQLQMKQTDKSTKMT